MNCTTAQASFDAYIEHTLDVAFAKELERHLAECTECATALAELRDLLHAVTLLPLERMPDTELWDFLSRRLSPRVQEERSVFPRTKWPPRMIRWRAKEAVLRRHVPLIVLTIIAAAVIVADWPSHRDPTRQKWNVVALDGTPRVGSTRIAKSGSLIVGDWLETDSLARARVSVGEIGEVDIEPRSLFHLVSVEGSEHRVELIRGTIHARIWAPPRLFFVETPSALAIDLGCAYTLSQDDSGAGTITVHTGFVAVQSAGVGIIVPAGFSCKMNTGAVPGLPVSEDASERFKTAAMDLREPQGKDAALNSVLSEATARDAITLYELLVRSVGADRNRIISRIDTLVGLPRGVTRSGLLHADGAMMEALLEEIGVPGFLLTEDK